MEDLLLKCLTVLYASIGGLAILGYWPTIKDLYHKKKSSNSLSYLIWSLAGGIAFLYSLFVLKDIPFRIVSGLNFGACLVVLYLSISLKSSK